MAQTHAIRSPEADYAAAVTQPMLPFLFAKINAKLTLPANLSLDIRRSEFERSMLY